MFFWQPVFLVFWTVEAPFGCCFPSHVLFSASLVSRIQHVAALIDTDDCSLAFFSTARRRAIRPSPANQCLCRALISTCRCRGRLSSGTWRGWRCQERILTLPDSETPAMLENHFRGHAVLGSGYHLAFGHTRSQLLARMAALANESPPRPGGLGPMEGRFAIVPLANSRRVGLRFTQGMTKFFAVQSLPSLPEQGFTSTELLDISVESFPCSIRHSDSCARCCVIGSNRTLHFLSSSIRALPFVSPTFVSSTKTTVNLDENTLIPFCRLPEKILVTFVSTLLLLNDHCVL